MTRESNIFVTRRVRKCLAKIAEQAGVPLDELADGILEDFIIANHAEFFALYTRHDEEEKAMLDTIKKAKV